jgi:cell wall-associated NlpC family hydrolase
MDALTAMAPFRLARLAPSGFSAVLVVMTVLLSGCSSTHSASRTTAQSAAASGSLSTAEAEARLQAAADRWSGTPHEWGGTSRRGVDCSGLVQSVFARQFDVQVPRTTEEQARTGRSVSRAGLQPGDLVFFRPGFKKRHVGIYLADGQFLHASASSGVTVSPLDRSYWQEHWWQGRRILPLNDDGADAPHRRTSDPAPAATAW